MHGRPDSEAELILQEDGDGVEPHYQHYPLEKLTYLTIIMFQQLLADFRFVFLSVRFHVVNVS